MAPSPESLANYVAVLEQIQNRKGQGNMQAFAGRESLPPEMDTKDSAKLAQGLVTADARAARANSLGEGRNWMSSSMETVGIQRADAKQEAVKATVGEARDKVELTSRKVPEGAPEQQRFTPTVQFEGVTTAAVDTGQVNPEVAVADQVSYWIAQGIQNAELTLEGADAQLVEVSISMSGNEAHVEFRTDQLETRELLTGSASHLKELLQSEGMVLSGLSVGSSGADASGNRDRRPPAGRQSDIRSAPEELTVRSVLPSRVPSRALDVFV